MDILFVHNYYQQPGGEDRVFALEAKLLKERGHRVIEYSVDNSAVDSKSRPGVAVRTVWNHREYCKMRDLLRRERPQMMHAHNVFPLISPALYHAARAEEVPVVQTLHNYRLACPAATLFRNGQVCTKCVGMTIPWPALRHGCYRDSIAASAAVAAMLTVHRWIGTWDRFVDGYIVPSRFSRDLLVEAGLPANKVFHKPNFTEYVSPPECRARHGAVFAGRLTPEKGVETMLDAWREVRGEVPLHIIGDGPLAGVVRDFAANTPNVHYHGWLEHERLLGIFRESAVLLMPSTWHEVFGLSVVEAYSCGLPVIASRVGGLTEIVIEGETGLHAEAGNSADLAAKVNWITAHSREREEMGNRARIEYERNYTPGWNYGLLMDVYRKAIGGFSSSLLGVSNSFPEPGVRFAPTEKPLSSSAGGHS